MAPTSLSKYIFSLLHLHANYYIYRYIICALEWFESPNYVIRFNTCHFNPRASWSFGMGTSHVSPNQLSSHLVLNARLALPVLITMIVQMVFLPFCPLFAIRSFKNKWTRRMEDPLYLSNLLNVQFLYDAWAIYAPEEIPVGSWSTPFDERLASLSANSPTEAFLSSSSYQQILCRLSTQRERWLGCSRCEPHSFALSSLRGLYQHQSTRFVYPRTFSLLCVSIFETWTSISNRCPISWEIWRKTIEER